MNTIWHLTKKNLRLLIRSKSSALIIVFAPLLLMLIIGLSFNTNDDLRISVGVYSSDFTADVEEFVTLLDSDFNIEKFDSVASCIKDIKHSLIHACVELPTDFSVTENVQKEIIFHIDPTRVNLVAQITTSVAGKFSLKSKEISELLTGNILNLVAESSAKLTDRDKDLSAISEKSKYVANEASATKSNIAGIDVKLPEKSYEITLVDALNKNVKDGLSKVDKAKDKINSSALTDSEKTTLLKSLQDAEKELSKVQVALDVSGSLKNLVGDLHHDVIVSKEKVDAASKALDAASSQLGGVTTELDGLQSSLDSLSSGLREIKSNLDGQKVSEAGVITSPLVTKISPVKEGTKLNFILPLLLVLVIMFSSLLLGTSLVMMEKNSPAYLRNYFVPAGRFSFVAAIYCTNLVLNFIGILVILGISLLFIENLVMVLPLATLILFVLASVFTFVGMGIGYLFNTEETGILASISLGSLLLFVSGVILPLESISGPIKDFVKFNPFVIGENLLREVLLFGSIFNDIWFNFVLIASYAIVLLIVIVVLEAILYKHLVRRFLNKHHRKHRQVDKKNEK
tara:strand:- start:6088 stop:7800 length:1713 start_codon:yes stop_codon:yes gene_type:complete